MNKLIKANTEKLNRLVNVSRSRRTLEMDFFTDASNKYRDFLNYPLAINLDEDASLTEIAKENFIEEAQRPLDGVIARQTRLSLDIKNMSQEQIKEDKRFIDNYFSRLDQMVKLVGYTIVGVEAVAPEKDRKSTRLNSSHRCISYAVFCLKKKNHTSQSIKSRDRARPNHANLESLPHNTFIAS